MEFQKPLNLTVYARVFFSEKSMSKIIVALACSLPFVLVGCGGESASAPLLTSPTNPSTAPTGSPSSGPTTPTSQTITFSSAPLALGSTVTLQGSASSGLPVIYASQTPSTCSVSESTVTALALGSCTLTVNQAGNTSFTAAPQVQTIISVLSAQSITGFNAPTLSVRGLAVVNPITTSRLPILLISLTPAVCSVIQNIAVAAVMEGTCTLYAAQAGNDQFAAAPPLTVSTTVTASNTTLAANAKLAPWMTTPQTGSTTTDSTTSLEGIYTNKDGDFAFIDGANHFNYYFYFGLLFGSLTQDTNNWTLNTSAIIYPKSSTATTAKGTFITKQTFKATAQSFKTISPLVDLTYSKANGFAASQADVMGSWLYNDGLEQFNLTIDSTGAITGTEFDNVGGKCSLMGKIAQTESASQHNMYKITLSASNVSGSFCNLDITGPYTGLAALSFAPAGANESNGYLPTLGILAQDAATNSPLKLTLLQP